MLGGRFGEMSVSALLLPVVLLLCTREITGAFTTSYGQSEATSYGKPEEKLLYGVHCFKLHQPLWLTNARWSPINGYIVAPDTSIELVDLSEDDSEYSIYGAACHPREGALDLVFPAVPPSCTLQIRVHFADSPQRQSNLVSVYANGQLLEADDRGNLHDVPIFDYRTPPDNSTLHILITATDEESASQLLVSGVQVFAPSGCPTIVHPLVQDLGTERTSGDIRDAQISWRSGPANVSLSPPVAHRSLYQLPTGEVTVVAASPRYLVLSGGGVGHPRISAFPLSGSWVAGSPAGTVVDKSGVPAFAALSAKFDWTWRLVRSGKNDLVAYFKVQSGKTYTITLLWAETNTSVKAGQRKLSVLANGATLKTGIDVVAAVGHKKAYAVTVSYTASSSNLNLAIRPTGTLGAVINAVQVKGTGVAPMGPDLRALAVGDASGYEELKLACGAYSGWKSLDGFLQQGYNVYIGKQTVQNVAAAAQTFWKTNCWETKSLTVVVPSTPGKPLTFVLHVSENYFTAAGKRVFSISVDGALKVANVDVYKKAGGGDKPTTITFSHTPAGYYTAVELTGSVNNPIINGLIIKTGSGPPAPNPPTMPPPPGPTPPPPPVPAPSPPPSWQPPAGVAACVPPSVLSGSTGVIEAAPGAIGFGDVDPGDPEGNVQSLLLTNPKGSTYSVTHISCPALSPTAVATWFAVQFGTAAAVSCNGSTKKALSTAFQLPGNGGSKTVVVTFSPQDNKEAAVKLTLWAGSTKLAEVQLTGRGGDPYADGHTLHPIIDAQPVFPAPSSGDGATVFLDGKASHTHGPGDTLKTFKWTDVGAAYTIKANAQSITCFYPFGAHSVLLTVTDDKGKSDSTLHTLVVSPNNKVSGTLIKLYKGGSVGSLPSKPVYALLSPSTFIFLQSPINNLPSGSIIVQMLASTYFNGKPVTFSVSGASTVWIGVDGKQVSNGVTISEGQHLVDMRVSLSSAKQVSLSINGAPVPFAISDISTHPPVINEVPTGTAAVEAGDFGLIKGFVLGPGATITLGGKAATVTKQTTASLEFTYPSIAAGTYSLVVKRAGKTSNSVSVKIVSSTTAPPPPPPTSGGGASLGLGGPMSSQPKFARKDVSMPFNPTRVVWCHGKAFVSPAYGGQINVIEFDSSYNAKSNSKVVSVPQPSSCGSAPKCAWATLGLACSPFESDTSWKLYFSLSKIYAQGGLEPKGFVPYDGYVYSIDMAASTKTAKVFISGLPVSNHDHAVNQLAFLPSGKLLIGIGGQTNAGVPHPKLGYLPESPLSAAVVVADIKKSGFNGKVTYKWASYTPSSFSSGKNPNDQRWGDKVAVATGDVAVYASGFRNPFGTTVTRAGKVMVTDNGPNSSFGDELLGVSSTGTLKIGSGFGAEDAIYYSGIPTGCHSGHASVPRCRAGDSRQCVFKPAASVSNSPPTWCKPNEIVESATGGIMQYNSYAFKGKYHDFIFVAGYKTAIWRMDPSSGSVVADTDDPNYPDNANSATDMIQAPGGVQLLADLSGKKVGVIYPVDSTVAASKKPTVYDIVPDRGPKSPPSGGITFTIGGAHFNTITGAITVKIGGATATSVSVAGPNWITGKLPPNSGGSCSSDVTITYSAGTLTLPKAFCYV